MRFKTVICLAFIAIASCNFRKEHSFDWLIGTWKRTNGNSEIMSLESWIKVDNEYRGIAVNIVGGDTIYREDITLRKDRMTYFYIADILENEEPTSFELIDISKTSFLAVNSEHDFPKEIYYIRSGDLLIASVSGNEEKIEYKFQKQ